MSNELAQSYLMLRWSFAITCASTTGTCLGRLNFFFVIVAVAVLYPLCVAAGVIEVNETITIGDCSSPRARGVNPRQHLLLLVASLEQQQRNPAGGTVHVGRTRGGCYFFNDRRLQQLGKHPGGVREENSFILFISLNQLYIIPKRFFSGEEEMEAFRHLLRRSFYER